MVMRRQYLQLSAALGAVGLGGCSGLQDQVDIVDGGDATGEDPAVPGPEKPSVQYDARNTGHVSSISVVPEEMEVQWAVGAGGNPAVDSDEQDDQEATLINAFYGVILGDDTLVVPTQEDGTDPAGTLFAFDAGSGEFKWEYSHDDSVTSTPIIYDETVYFAFMRELVALDIEDGEELWTESVELGDGTFGEPIANDGLVVIAVSGELHAYDADDGEQEWVNDEIADLDEVLGIDEERVYVSSASAYAHDLQTGEQEWQNGVEWDVDTPMVVGEDNVFFGHRDEYLALDKTTGEDEWRLDAEGSSGGDAEAAPVLVGDSVVLNYENEVAAVDPATGDVRWTIEDVPYAASGVATDSELYYTMDAGGVYSEYVVVRVDLEEGELNGTYSVDEYNDAFTDYSISRVQDSVFTGDQLFLLTSEDGTTPDQQLIALERIDS